MAPRTCHLDAKKDRQFDALYVAIGKFLVSWSHIEYEMYRCTKMVYVNCAAPMLPEKFPSTIEGKIHLFENALSKDPRLSDMTLDGRKLTAHIWRHRDLRNDLVHSAISGIENASTVTFLRPPKTGPAGRSQRKQVNLALIEKHGQEMEALCFALGCFVAQFERALHK